MERWQHITALYYEDVDNGLKLLPRLTYEHINLNAYSVMRVNLAAQVMSASVASVLKAFGPPEASATAKLCEMVDGFFDCLNVQSKTEHVVKRKPFLAPYTSPDDRRYGFVFTTFVNLDNSQQANVHVMGFSTCNAHVYYFVLILQQSPTYFLPIEFYVKRKPFSIIINAFYFLTGIEIIKFG